MSSHPPAIANANAAIEVAQANFSLGLLSQTTAASPASSAVLSPISAAIALAMVYVGARKDTAKEFGSVLTNGRFGGRLIRRSNIWYVK